MGSELTPGDTHICNAIKTKTNKYSCDLASVNSA